MKQAALSPAEGDRKVLVLEDFHRIDQFGAILLKYVEEPPPSTFFVILAEDVPPELVTIASRSVRIDLGPVPLRDVDRAARRPRASTPDAGRRRWPPRRPAISTAPGCSPPTTRFAVRAAALRAMPGRLNDTGARAAELAAEIKALIDDAQDAIDARHEQEAAELEERIERYGQRGSGKKDVDRPPQARGPPPPLRRAAARARGLRRRLPRRAAHRPPPRRDRRRDPPPRPRRAQARGVPQRDPDAAVPHGPAPCPGARRRRVGRRARGWRPSR